MINVMGLCSFNLNAVTQPDQTNRTLCMKNQLKSETNKWDEITNLWCVWVQTNDLDSIVKMPPIGWQTLQNYQFRRSALPTEIAVDCFIQQISFWMLENLKNLIANRNDWRCRRFPVFNISKIQLILLFIPKQGFYTIGNARITDIPEQ